MNWTRDKHDEAEGNCPLGCPWCDAIREEEQRAHELGVCEDDCPICEEMEADLRRHEEREAYAYARAEWGW